MIAFTNIAHKVFINFHAISDEIYDYLCDNQPVYKW